MCDVYQVILLTCKRVISDASVAISEQQTKRKILRDTQVRVNPKGAPSRSGRWSTGSLVSRACTVYLGSLVEEIDLSLGPGCVTGLRRETKLVI